MTDKFTFGRVYVSTGAQAALTMPELAAVLERHGAGERRANGTGSQIVSEFSFRASGVHSLQVWVVTEPHLTRTVVMLPRETPYRQDDIEFNRTDGVSAEEVLLSSSGLRFVSRDHPANRPTAASKLPPSIANPPQPPASSRAPGAAPMRAPNSTPKAPVRADIRTPPTTPPPRTRDAAYWDETAGLLLDYFELLAGPDCGVLVDEFTAWLKRSPEAGRRYQQGDDMDRAALVERYLKIRALPRG